MKVDINEHITTLFYDGLKKYLSGREEEALTQAYEQGREALQKGLSELDIIALYHRTLAEVYEDFPELEHSEKLNQSSRYLIEWLAPFEVRLRSYIDMVNKLNKKNDLLKEQIENRKKAEEELHRSRAYFQSLIENSQGLITVLDQNAIIRYISPSVERILGYKPAELQGRYVFQYIHPDDKPKVIELFYEVANSYEQVQSAEYRVRHKEEKWTYLDNIAKSVPDSIDGAMVVVNSMNITERKINTQKLQDNKQQLDEAQRIAKVGSWEWRPHLKKGVNWSPEMYRIFGIKVSREMLELKSMYKYIHPDDLQEVKDTIESTFDKRQAFSMEHRISRPDGEIRVVMLRGHVVGGRESPVRMIGTAQDVTDIKEREEKLREYSERLRNLSARIEKAREDERVRISREVHDELGQMLTVLKMDISIFFDDVNQKYRDKESDLINKEEKRILNRINGIIKSVQRITTELRPEVLDDLGLKDALEWQAHEFGKRTGIEVEFESDFLDTAFLDEEQSTTLFRIFQETLTNVVRHANASKVEIELGRENNHLFLCVDDNGSGITSSQKESSSSLGLIGMKERTQILGGKMEIEGKQDEGTKVLLKIPLNRGE